MRRPKSQTLALDFFSLLVVILLVTTGLQMNNKKMSKLDLKVAESSEGQGILGEDIIVKMTMQRGKPVFELQGKKYSFESLRLELAKSRKPSDLVVQAESTMPISQYLKLRELKKISGIVDLKLQVKQSN
ncbi:MAG: hypothetical protein QNL04_11020 [SAR324 cluster bacterium]|nr:hypothetical protein [SAR324 cluster bacterium]